ncbi:TonB family protein [Sphingomonas piscis]|uniref:TonB family protein n=2 Tax=Sphingomonas piscis TaxID=2714943 RepID=A0A6G7YRY0_9SPHN|nr:energy transducer TonB [Sphingomonas piscis]QIK79497.1 TonB family protein [Sphingomonas piscis]
MSYANRKQMSSNRTAAIIVVALIHAVLGYALVTGLAYNVVKKAAEDLKTFDVEEEPPPPEEEPPPPEETPQETPPPPVAAPPPLVRTPVQESPVQATPNPPPVVPITPRATPAPPAPPAPPPPPRQLQPKSVVGNLQGLIRDTDYPESAIDRDEQGTVTVSLTVGPNGRVSGCSVAASSGSRTLDSTTCRILQSRARFTPAQDSSGNPTSGTVSQRITWRLAG